MSAKIPFIKDEATIESQVEDTKRELEELTSLESRLESEDLIVQEKNWLEERTKAQRDMEDTQREELYQKQKLLEEKRKQQAERLVQNRQMQLYNQMHEAEQADQIYGLNGISLDKVEGMVEYKNALYQGISLAMFIVAIAICVAAYCLCGVESVLFFAMLALTGAQTSILLHEDSGKLQGGLYGFTCRVLGIMATPIMALLLVLHQIPGVPMSYVYYGCAIFAVALYLIGGGDFFIRNPYKATGRAAKRAKQEIRELKHSAAKTVKKNQKLRHRLEARLVKKQQRQERLLDRLKSREQERAQRLSKRLEHELDRREQYQQLIELRRQNREQKALLRKQKLVDFKERIKELSPISLKKTNNRAVLKVVEENEPVSKNHSSLEYEKKDA